MKEIINRLNSIKAYCKLMNRQEQSIQWQKDIEALNEAVKGLQELMAYREEYEKMIDKKLKAVKEELMVGFKEEPSLDGWKVGDKYYVRFDGREIHIETIGCDDEGEIYDFDIFNIKHGYAKHTAEEVQFQMERDAVLYELSKYAEPKDRKWNGSNRHWYIVRDFIHGHNGVYIEYSYLIKGNDIYFASREDAEKAIEEIGESRIRKYYLMVGDDE